MKLIFSLTFIAFSAVCQGEVVKGVKQITDRVTVTLTEGTLSICPLTNGAVRIKFFKGTEERTPELIFTSSIPTPEFHVSDSPSNLEIIGEHIVVRLDKQNGNLSFADRSGKTFLSEKPGTRKLVPDSVTGEPCYVVEQSFDSPKDEYLFGLGQFQDGYYNVRNLTRKLIQVNSQISIPFIYSSRGYGILWHQYGLTWFNPADSPIPLTKSTATSGEAQEVEVTTTSGTQKVSRQQSLYSGQFTVDRNGEYSMMLDLGDMDSRHLLVIDDSACIDQSNIWLPSSVSALVNLKAGVHKVQVVCRSSNTPKLTWKLAGDETTFRSPNAKSLDYVVFYGPSADSVIASYRNLSGNVPMLPRWAYGFWQCRERYTSGANLVATVQEFRKRQIPMDVIVQDWQYWGNNGWGVPQFDTANYADPSGFIKEIHDQHAHFNISIWSNPDKNSTIGKEYVSKNLYIANTKWLDYFNPLTRESYWNTLEKNLFSQGVDSWWMDATEPENDALKGTTTYLGSGDFYRLTYPLFVSQAVYEGQRKATSDKRVCILTRSAFAGQQRYGTINWSGDIGGNWDSYRRQIVAGLDYAMTGMPYWTTDIGGFFRPGPSQYTDVKYQELLTRWYQWGAFNPIFRIHGYQSETEPWNYGEQVEGRMRKMLNLRYRLLPYIYSEAWQITKHGSTMMRPLVIDFNSDTAALNQRFEYMFGTAILVAPITEPDVNEWRVYLPKSATWYNFWTGERFDGGYTTNTPAPVDIIPLFVKGGSIIPMGKFIQFAGQKPEDTLEIRIYRGANGRFDLYEDEGDNYNYEKGKFTTVPFNWDNEKSTLTIGAREGAYPGMLDERTFNIVMVNGNRGTGVEISSTFDKKISYEGKKLVISF
ncbi:MAG: TIM-barrel domain-containing protein [Bacteroidota bacterium]